MDDDVRGWAHRSRIGIISVCVYVYVCVHNKERAIINEWNGMGRDDVTEQKRRPQNYTTARAAGRSRSNQGAGEGVGTRQFLEL